MRGLLLTMRTNFIKITISAAGYSENNDALYQDYEEVQEVTENELMKTPTFRSLAQRFEANVGDTVRLPCLVDRLEGFVILWKKGSEIITVASQVLDKVGRLSSELNIKYSLDKSSIFHL